MTCKENKYLIIKVACFKRGSPKIALPAFCLFGGGGGVGLGGGRFRGGGGLLQNGINSHLIPYFAEPPIMVRHEINVMLVVHTNFFFKFWL